MSGESADARLRAEIAEQLWMFGLPERHTELTADELRQLDSWFDMQWCGFPIEQWALVAALAIFSKTFLETLAKHAADGVADLVRARFRKSGKTIEYLVGADDAAAAIVVTRNLPDEARLALLDLDVSAPELCGKELHWDQAAAAWRPSDALPAKPNEATDGD